MRKCLLPGFRVTVLGVAVVALAWSFSSLPGADRLNAYAASVGIGIGACTECDVKYNPELGQFSHKFFIGDLGYTCDTGSGCHADWKPGLCVENHGVSCDAEALSADQVEMQDAFLLAMALGDPYLIDEAAARAGQNIVRTQRGEFTLQSACGGHWALVTRARGLEVQGTGVDALFASSHDWGRHQTEGHFTVRVRGS